MRVVFAVAALGIGPVLGQVDGGTITYVTPSGSTINGLPVDAEAVLTTGTDTVTITLTNLEANPKSVAQNLSDLTFTLSGGTVTSLSSNSGQEITVNSNGTFSLGSTVSTGWALAGSGTSTGTVEVLGAATAPKHTIIGPPGGGGTYSDANNSISGNGPHNPFLNQTATFTILGTGITADTTITGAIFSFNSDRGFTVVGQAVPEPSSLVLSVIGLGLAGTIGYCRRRLRA
jgi:hypothetical protein